MVPIVVFFPITVPLAIGTIEGRTWLGGAGPICDLPSVNDNCGDIHSKQTLLVDSDQMLRPCHSFGGNRAPPSLTASGATAPMTARRLISAADLQAGSSDEVASVGGLILKSATCGFQNRPLNRHSPGRGATRAAGLSVAVGGRGDPRRQLLLCHINERPSV
jgi:hypothetical protein